MHEKLDLLILKHFYLQFCLVEWKDIENKITSLVDDRP